MLNLNSTMIGSEKPDRLTEFYGKFLGKPQFVDGGFCGWEVGAAWLTIGPHDDVKGMNKQPERIMLNFETKDVPAEFKRIKETGATVVQEPYTPGEMPKDVKIATFCDPDGNYFQLMTPMPAEVASR